MITTYIHSFQSEWLKRKRSAATWLVAGGAFFIPAIMLIAQFVNHEELAERNLSADFWKSYLFQSWQSMAIALLPMGIILVSSLLAQLEYRNNTWKQLHATPQSYTLIFFTKLSVIMVMMLVFMVLFHIGIYLSAVIPALLLSDVPYPAASFPMLHYLKTASDFFIAALPLIALQQLIALNYRNFLASVGIGLGFIVASFLAISWKYGYILPFTHTAIHFIMMSGNERVVTFMPMPVLSVCYFLFFIAIAYLLYITKRQKG